MPTIQRLRECCNLRAFIAHPHLISLADSKRCGRSRLAICTFDTRLILYRVFVEDPTRLVTRRLNRFWRTSGAGSIGLVWYVRVVSRPTGLVGVPRPTQIACVGGSRSKRRGNYPARAEWKRHDAPFAQVPKSRITAPTSAVCAICPGRGGQCRFGSRTGSVAHHTLKMILVRVGCTGGAPEPILHRIGPICPILPNPGPCLPFCA